MTKSRSKTRQQPETRGGGPRRRMLSIGFGFKDFSEESERLGFDDPLAEIEKKEARAAEGGRKLFRTQLEEDESLPLACGSDSRAALDACVEPAAELTHELPDWLAYGPGGVNSVVVDKLGRRLRPRQRIWAAMTEQTDAGLEAEERRKEQRALPREAGQRRKKIVVNKGRHGATYMNPGKIIKFRIHSATGGSRQAPQMLLQYDIDESQIKGYGLNVRNYGGGWVSARGWHDWLPIDCVDGHVSPDPASRDGLELTGAINFAAGGMQSGAVEKIIPGRELKMRAGDEAKVPEAAKIVRSSITETVDPFAAIALGVAGWTSSSGPILTGCSASLGWAHIYIDSSANELWTASTGD